MPDDRYTPTDAPADSEPITRDQLDTPNFKYPAKLVTNKKVIADRGNQAGAIQWFQEFARADRKWSTGEPVIDRNRLMLRWKDGTPVSKGSQADVVGQAFADACGCDMWPDTEGNQYFIGCWFMMSSEKVPGTERIYISIPTEYLGTADEYKYEGNVRVVESKQGGGGEEASTPTPRDDRAGLEDLLSILDGMSLAEVQEGKAVEAVREHKAFQEGGLLTVLGVSVRGGLIRGGSRDNGDLRQSLLKKLIDQEVVEVGEDGVIHRV